MNTNTKANTFFVTPENEIEAPGETTVQSVAMSMDNLFHARVNLPKAAHDCGMTQREMKMAFWEYIRRTPTTYKDNEDA